ncbi:hypothetical protein FOB22_003516 [Saccharomyces cerevisiae]|nr:hypothetical protein FOB22_003516 [Saccharomyces cerevisiae]
MQGLSKDVRALCLLGWPESIVSEDGLEALAVERMLRNDEEYKEYLEDIEPYHGDPQISEVWLLPHWLDLANVEVLAADDTRVPLYMLMVAVHKELDSDDVPDGRFDILLCRDSSREVGE